MTGLMNRAMPLTIEEIDREWLTAALRSRVPDAAVHGFAIGRVIRGTCTKIWLELELNDAARRAGVPETVVLKGGFEPHSRAMSIMHDYEVFGYRDVFPELKLNTPACYFADYDESIGQGIVMMEDLTARGVTFCNPLQPQSYEQVARRLTALAQYHAKTWDSPELDPGGRWEMVKRPDFNYQYYIDRTLDPDLWQADLALPRGAATSVRFHDPALVRDALRRLHRHLAEVPQAIVHGDTHLGNLYLDADGAPGFYDSLPCRNSVIQEISYHITGALDPADRRHWERALVRHYLDEAARAGAPPLDFDEAMRQYSMFLMVGFAVWLGNDAVFQSESVNTACAARFSAAMIDNDTLGHLAQLKGL